MDLHPERCRLPARLLLASLCLCVPALAPPVASAQSQPSLSVGDAQTSEGTDAVEARTMSFTVELSVASAEPVTVEFATGDGTATAPADYASAIGTVTIPAGHPSETVEVDLVPDGDPEVDETFTLRLSNATGAAIADGTAQGTVLDDDASRRTISSAGPIERVYLEDDLVCQARYRGDQDLQFFSSVPGSCGTSLFIGDSGYGHQAGSSFTPVSQSGPTGAGTAANPYRVTTTVDVGQTGLRITRVDRYVSGEHHYRSDITVTNTSSGAQRGVLYHSADCYLQDSDSGYGYHDPSTGGIYCSANPHNSPAGRIQGFVPISSGSRFHEDRYSSVYAAVNGAPFPNLCRCTEFLDNGMGLSWNVSVPAEGQTTRSFVTAFSPTGVAVDPTPDPAPTTTEAPPPPAETTPPPPAPAAPPADGETDFPSGTPTGRTISDLPQPRTGQTVNIGRVRGRVLVRFPEDEGARASRSARGSQSARATREFVPLDGSAQIPVGSTVDTTKGVLRMQSGANGSGSRTQTATFHSGMFEMRQAKTRRPVTEMVLKGGSFRDACRASGSASASADAGGPTAGDARARRRSGRRYRRVRRGKRVRRLWGSGRGRYRTRGRYSSATVRGTKWVVEERCNGTFTRVARRPRSSRVVVRDFVTRRNITLRAGDSYFSPRGRIAVGRIGIRPARTTPGGSTTVTGRGWPARRVVTLRIRRAGDGSLARVVRVRASRRGGFKKRVRLRGNEPLGRYTLQACDRGCAGEVIGSLVLRAP